MYLNAYSNKSHKDDEEEVIAQQLHGWVYESHCWTVMHAHRPNFKICKWCGRKSSTDMQMDKPGGHAMCKDNPAMKTLFAILMEKQ